jgi:hypothetical protein
LDANLHVDSTLSSLHAFAFSALNSQFRVCVGRDIACGMNILVGQSRFKVISSPIVAANEDEISFSQRRRIKGIRGNVRAHQKPDERIFVS